MSTAEQVAITTHRVWKEFFENGWCAFPVRPPMDPYYANPNLFDSETHGSSVGKVPAISNWRKYPYRKPVESMTRYNIGLRLTDWQLVIDVDVGEGKKGWESFKNLQEDLKLDLISLANYQVRTGSGGMHLGFRIPAGTKIRSRLKDYPNIDFQGEGKFVLGPTSMHRNGKRYVLLKPKKPGDINPFKLEQCPDLLLDLLRRHTDPEGAIDPSLMLDDYDDSDENILRAISLINFHPAAIEGHGGDQTTLQLGMKLHEMGVSPERALDLMMTHYNYRCDPEWAEDEMAVKVNNAYKYATKPMGSKNFRLQLEKDEADGELLIDLEDGEDDSKPKTPALAREKDLALVCPPYASQRELVAEERAWKQRLSWMRNKDNKVLLSQNDYTNLRLLVEFLPDLRLKLRYNLFTRIPTWVESPPWMARNDPFGHQHFPETGVPMNDEHLHSLRDYISFYGEDEPSWSGKPLLKGGYKHSRQQLEDVIIATSIKHPFHPLRDRMAQFYREWDGKPRLNTWLVDYANVDDNPLSREMSRLTALAVVFRLFDPGHKYDYMMILEGEQNLAKSMVPRLLALEDEWFFDSPFDPTSAQEVLEVTGGKLVIELPEMSIFNKVESKAMKQFVTAQSDKGRLAFRRYPDEVQRQFILIGTTNEKQYLMDETGNRRYVPILVNSAVKAKELRRDMAQIYGEAMHELISIKKYCDEHGLKLRHYELTLTEEAAAIAKQDQAMRMKTDERTYYLHDYLDGRTDKPIPDEAWVDDKGRVVGITTADAAKGFFGVPYGRVDKKMQMEIGRMMAELGWVKLRKVVNNSRIYVSMRPGYEALEFGEAKLQRYLTEKAEDEVVDLDLDEFFEEM